MDNDAATNTQICMPTPGETKVAVNAAIEKGATEGARLALETAKNASSEAAAAIAKLTDRVQKVTKEHVRLGLNHGYLRLQVMPLTVEDTPELFFRNRTSGFLDPKKLRNAAALIYAHCMSADLNPHLIYQSEPDEDGEKGWFMFISWTLPHSLAPDVPRKRKFTGFWFWLNWLN